MTAFILKYRGVAELIAFALLSLGAFLAWQHHDSVERADGAAKVLAASQAAAQAQAQADAKAISDARAAYSKEIEDAKNLAAQPASGRVLCYYAALPSEVPKADVHANISASSSAVVPGDLSVHPDIEPALKLLSLVGDSLAASARELNSETHSAAPP